MRGSGGAGGILGNIADGGLVPSAWHVWPPSGSGVAMPSRCSTVWSLAPREALLQQQPAFGSSVGTVSSLAEQAALAASPRSEKCSAESLAPEPVETGGGACRSGAGVPISL